MPDHLHNMGSMALGVGTSAVGSPGFGQNPGALGHGASHHYTPQLGGGLLAHTGGLPGDLLAHTAAAAPRGSYGAYHPFGSAGGTSVGLQSQSSGLNTGV